jgi:hypothetical protein
MKYRKYIIFRLIFNLKLNKKFFFLILLNKNKKYFNIVNDILRKIYLKMVNYIILIMQLIKKFNIIIKN